MGRDVGQSQQCFLELGFPTYAAVVQGFTPPATPTDFAVLTNPSASLNVLLLTEAWINGIATAAATVDIWLYKRTALDTGGTSAGITTCCYDTKDPATPQATPLTYSVLPSPLGAGQILRQSHMILAVAATPAIPEDRLDWVFDLGGSAKMPRIRPGECVAFNYNGAALGAGSAFDFGFEWIEVPAGHDYVRVS